jgi:hypothetical protein
VFGIRVVGLGAIPSLLGQTHPQNVRAAFSSVAWKDRASTPFGSSVNLPNERGNERPTGFGILFHQTLEADRDLMDYWVGNSSSSLASSP